jgi:hypothetical protein
MSVPREPLQVSVFHTEADIARVPSMQDRRELRNFQRFLRLWPHHGFDMLARPRWQKYLAITPDEAAMLQKRPPFTTK